MTSSTRKTGTNSTAITMKADGCDFVNKTLHTVLRRYSTAAYHSVTREKLTQYAVHQCWCSYSLNYGYTKLSVAKFSFWEKSSESNQSYACNSYLNKSAGVTEFSRCRNQY